MSQFPKSLTISVIQKLINAYEEENIKNDDFLLLNNYYTGLNDQNPNTIVGTRDAFNFWQILLTLETTAPPNLQNTISEIEQSDAKGFGLGALRILKKANILNFTNYETIENYKISKKSDYKYFKEALALAENRGLLTQNIFNRIAERKYLILILDSLKYFLAENGKKMLQTEQNLEDLLLSKKPADYEHALNQLVYRNIYTPENLKIIRGFRNAPAFGIARAILKSEALDSEENLLMLTNPIKSDSKYIHEYSDIADMLVLSKKHNLGHQTQEELLKHISCHLIAALKKLETIDDEIITQAVKVKPYNFKHAVEVLEKNFHHFQKYVSTILKTEHPDDLNSAIQVLGGCESEYAPIRRPNLLSKETMEKLLSDHGVDYAIGTQLLFLGKIYNADTMQKIYQGEKLDEKDQRILEKLLFESVFNPTRYETLKRTSVNYLEIAERNGLVGDTFKHLNKIIDFKSIKTINDLDKIIIKYFNDYPEFILELAQAFDYEYIKHISNECIAKMMNVANNDPKINHILAKFFGRLISIEFFDRGSSSDTWWNLTNTLIKRLPIPKSNPKKRLMDDLFNDNEDITINNFSLNDRLQNGWKFLRLQGRTILLEDKELNILAIKIQKKFEDPNELKKEYRTVKFLNEHKSDLKLDCYFPNQQGISTVDSQLLTSLCDVTSKENVDAFTKMIGKKEQYYAYVYQVDKQHRDYFVYLNDPSLSDEDFRIASHNAIKNLLLLLAQGLIFNQLADIFHNTETGSQRRPDLGRFIVLSNLLSPMALDGRPNGLGRLTGWKKSVEFPNVRGRNAPVADVGDRISSLECMFNGDFAHKFFSSANEELKEHVGNYILANFIAEYQYVFFLISGRRAAELTKQAITEGKSKEEIDKIWQMIADQLVTNCALAVSLFGFQTLDEAKRSLLSFINVDRLACQMHMFMTDEYIPYIQKETLPTEIYGNETSVDISIERFREGTFNPVSGFCINQTDPDLGPVNGQEPLKEMNKLLYEMINKIVSSYHDFRLTLDSFKNYGSHSFFNLSGKQYHCQQIELEKLLLASDKISSDDKEIIKDDLAYHQKIKAVYNMQKIWRSKQDKRNKESQTDKQDDLKPKI